MDVHAAAIIGKHRLGHEGCGLAIGCGDIMDHILIHLQPVSHDDHGVELQAQLVLGRRHLVVVLFRLHAQLAHDSQHFAAQVLC